MMGTRGVNWRMTLGFFYVNKQPDRSKFCQYFNVNYSSVDFHSKSNFFSQVK